MADRGTIEAKEQELEHTYLREVGFVRDDDAWRRGRVLLFRQYEGLWGIDIDSFDSGPDVQAVDAVRVGFKSAFDAIRESEFLVWQQVSA